MRCFAQLQLGEDALPDETTILKFGRIIEVRNVSERLFDNVNDYLSEQGIPVWQGSMVDATPIQTPNSTKNKEKQKNSNMHPTRKGNQSYFGMKVHIGTEVWRLDGATRDTKC